MTKEQSRIPPVGMAELGASEAAGRPVRSSREAGAGNGDSNGRVHGEKGANSTGARPGPETERQRDRETERQRDRETIRE